MGSYSVKQIIIRLFIAISAGIIGGVIFAAIVYAISMIKRHALRRWLLFFEFLVMVISIPWLADRLRYPEAKFIAIIIAGYSVERILGADNDDLPIHEFDKIILFAQPFLYGTAGGEINLHIIDASLLWRSLVIILVSDTIRFATTYVVCFSKFYHEMSLNQKEHLFVATTWSTKGSVQAALSQSLVNQVSQLVL